MASMIVRQLGKRPSRTDDGVASVWKAPHLIFKRKEATFSPLIS